MFLLLGGLHGMQLIQNCLDLRYPVVTTKFARLNTPTSSDVADGALSTRRTHFVVLPIKAVSTNSVRRDIGCFALCFP